MGSDHEGGSVESSSLATGRSPSAPRLRSVAQGLVGLLGWFVLNGAAAWLASSAPAGSSGAAYAIGAAIANIAVLAYLILRCPRAVVIGYSLGYLIALAFAAFVWFVVLPDIEGLVW